MEKRFLILLSISMMALTNSFTNTCDVNGWVTGQISNPGNKGELPVCVDELFRDMVSTAVADPTKALPLTEERQKSITSLFRLVQQRSKNSIPVFIFTPDSQAINPYLAIYGGALLGKENRSFIILNRTSVESVLGEKAVDAQNIAQAQIVIVIDDESSVVIPFSLITLDNGNTRIAVVRTPMNEIRKLLITDDADNNKNRFVTVLNTLESYAHGEQGYDYEIVMNLIKAMFNFSNESQRPFLNGIRTLLGSVNEVYFMQKDPNVLINRLHMRAKEIRGMSSVPRDLSDNTAVLLQDASATVTTLIKAFDLINSTVAAKGKKEWDINYNTFSDMTKATISALVAAYNDLLSIGLEKTKKVGFFATKEPEKLRSMKPLSVSW